MIIDTHVHIGTGLGFNMTEEDVIYSMDKYKIDFALVSNVEAASCDHNRNPIPSDMQKSQIECLQRSLKFARANKGRIGILPWVKPLEEITTEFKDLIENNLDIIKGIKFHPFHGGFSFSSPEYRKYIDLATEYGLPVVTHTGTEYDDNPQRVFKMAQKYPDTKFVMVHLGLGSDNKEATELCKNQKNLYGDTTWVSINSALEFIKQCGNHKLMFGSDSPIDGKDTYAFNFKGDRSLYQEYFNEFKEKVSKETFDRIMWQNAMEVFNIKPSDIATTPSI